MYRRLGAASAMGAAVGEVFAAARNISDGDPRTWPPAFAALGEQTGSLGHSVLPKHPVSARDHFQRASMYYRAAEYYDDPVTATSRAHGIASRDLFLEALGLMPWKTEVLQIPFERAWLPGYFMRPPVSAAQPRKTVIVLTGFDGTAEELYFQTGAAALERGWNVLLAEGPGQTGLLRFHPDVSFRPDYERPVGAMIDYVLSRADVDPQRLALYGISFGGYFVSRAAAHDQRIKALVANSPIPDLRAYIVGFIGGDIAINPPPLKLEEIDNIPDQQMPPGMKLSLKASFRRFGVNDFAGWLERLGHTGSGMPFRISAVRALLWLAKAREGPQWSCSRASVAASVGLSRSAYSRRRRGQTPTVSSATCHSPMPWFTTGLTKCSHDKADPSGVRGVAYKLSPRRSAATWLGGGARKRNCIPAQAGARASFGAAARSSRFRTVETCQLRHGRCGRPPGHTMVGSCEQNSGKLLRFLLRHQRMMRRNITMRFRRRGSSTLVVLVGITLGIGLQGAAAQDRLLQEAVEFTGAVLFFEHKVPGLVIGAIRGPERAVSGFGETRKGTGVSPGEQTVFRIGSVTKAFTGEVLASLVAGGTLKLTDPLEKHLDWDVPIPGRDGKVVRLIDLATHSGGFPREVPHDPGPPDDPLATVTKESFKRSLSRDRLLFAPGTGALYSNMGFDLLAAALAGASGKTYADLLRERITARLRMNDTGFSLSPDQKARLMQGHDFDGKPLPDVPTGPIVVGSGGLYSSVSDVLTWLQWHLDRSSQDGAEVRLIDHATWLARDGLIPVYGFDESGKMDGMGLAWVVMMPQGNRPLILQKAGGLQGIFCYAAFAPTRGVGVFVAISQFNFGAAMAMATAVNDMIAAMAPP